jgi:ABC-type multidrug transport system ATPase subunit
MEYTTEQSLSWKNIFYSVQVRDKQGHRKERVILNYVSGFAKAQLLAILGPTASGKTCLLNALCNRIPYSRLSRLEGEIIINGASSASKNISYVSAYVMQDDALFTYLTVEETLTLSAYFHFPPYTSKQNIQEAVSKTIRQLGLGKVSNSLIGGGKSRGISGGERKRVAIGKELITNPGIIFLDEPTSGLDSFQAQSVVESLKALATNGRLVITVIHQPRSSIFAMFDQVILNI